MVPAAPAKPPERKLPRGISLSQWNNKDLFQCETCPFNSLQIADVIDHKTKSAPLKDFAREIPWRDEGNIINNVGDRVYIKE